MPASMMSAPTGGRPNVIGSSIAMVASGPTPGSTPISVPTIAPTRQRPILVGWAATEKPMARLAMRSCMTVSPPKSETRPELERQIEQVRKQNGAEDGQSDRHQDGFEPFDLVGTCCRQHDRDEAGDDQAGGPDQGAKHD